MAAGAGHKGVLLTPRNSHGRLRQELLKHLHNEYYRFAREVAPTHFCYEEIADAKERVARRESLVDEFLTGRFDGGSVACK